MTSTLMSAPTASQVAEFEEAASRADLHLNKEEFGPAFDMIMVASRITPSDPRLFDLVILFIEKAEASHNEEAILMAEDLLGRGDSLVHFQSPENVQRSRDRLSAIRKSFAKVPQATTYRSFDSVHKLLAVAENSSTPLNVRSRAVEQARIALDDARLDHALSSVKVPRELDSDELNQLQSRIDKAEKQCVGELFLQAKQKIDQWVAATSLLTKDVDKAPSEKVPDLSKQITALLPQGFCLFAGDHAVFAIRR